MSKRAIGRPTFTYLFAICFALLSVIGVAARVNDPWKDKDPQDWDEKDVQKILTDSPWCRQFQIGSATLGSMGASSTTVGSAAHPGSGNDPLAMPGPPPPGSTDVSSGMGPVTKFTVSWHSSRTVREALLREKELAGSLPDIARKDLAAKYDSYQIYISGTNLKMFGKEGVESLKEHSFLALKNSKAKIAPDKVVLQMSQGGNLVAILFDFPQKTAAGEPTIAPGEKSAEFSAKAGSMPLKVTFDISKMSTKQGPDL